MRIGVNTRLLLKDRIEGIGRYAYETLSRMVKAHPEDTFYFFFDRPNDAAFVFEKNVIPIVAGPQARHPHLFYIWNEITIPYLLKKHKIEVYFSPESFGSCHTKVPTCITVHDLAYLHYPKFITKLNAKYLKKFQPKFIEKARQVIAVSDFTKEDIMQQYHTPNNKISVITNAASDIFKPLDFDQKLAVRNKYTNGKQYFIYTGSLNPRKNIINMLKAFVKFKRLQKTPMKMVMVGKLGWLTKEIEEAKNRMPYKEDVIWTGYLPDEEMAPLVAAAYAMVYPSIYEGFGIPIVEAINCYTPIITSNTSSMPEVAGDAALFVDPESVEDIADKMGIMYKNELLRAQLIEAAKKQIHNYSWDKSATELYKILQKTMQQ